ncbi:hypothetical protein IM543_14535 [Massilia sp. UMI-21]|nr:hypothetical protein IM543_14535 [Massilia sp. UMI-21]
MTTDNAVVTNNKLTVISMGQAANEDESLAPGRSALRDRPPRQHPFAYRLGGSRHDTLKRTGIFAWLEFYN